MELLAEHGALLLTLAVILGFLMAWGIGANDVANAMATSVGTKSLTVVQALVVAAIFEFLGAFLAGGEVTNTIKQGIVDPASFGGDTFSLTLGMISALFAGHEAVDIQSGRLMDEPSGRSCGADAVHGKDTAVCNAELDHKFFLGIVRYQSNVHKEPPK